MKPRRDRPKLRLELGDLGLVDPFRLALAEHPPGSSKFFVGPPTGPPRMPVDLASLNLVGAGQALLGLSVRWMGKAGQPVDSAEPPFGEVRMIVRRRDARLLSALLRRHLQRLPQPPGWMPELLASMEQIDEFLRWDDPGVPGAVEDHGL